MVIASGVRDMIGYGMLSPIGNIHWNKVLI